MSTNSTNAPTTVGRIDSIDLDVALVDPKVVRGGLQ